MRTLLLLAALAGSALLVTAQNTPRGVAKQARADHKMDEAGKVRRDESLSKTPKVVRERDKAEHKEHKKHRMSM